MNIGILGGTGPAGKGLALRLAAAGHDVWIGSRDPERARAVVERAVVAWPTRDLGARLHAADNEASAEQDLVVVATPWEGTEALVSALAPRMAGKVVLSMVCALTKAGRSVVPTVLPLGSAAAHVQAAAPESRVVAALHHVPAVVLAALNRPVDCDVLLCSDDPGARAEATSLLGDLPGVHVFDGGPLASSGPIEMFTATLIQQSIRYRGAAGIRLTGIESQSSAGAA